MKYKNVSLYKDFMYREFPRMLFLISDDGRIYFDVTEYLKTEENRENRSVIDFEEKFSWWITVLCEAYSIPREELIVTGKKDGHLLMEESLSLLFAAYLDSSFAVYMLERISEMLVTGIVLSDTALISMAKDRLTDKDLT